jgi:hypothetical protein
MNEISPELFIWEKYCGRAGCAVTDILTGQNRLRPGIVALGYCDATRLKVRPRSIGFAVLVRFEDGMEVWFHCHALPKEPTV